MAIKKLRIVLDTNWYISATINRNSRRQLYNILTNNNITALFCEQMLDEYRSVIGRSKFKRSITSNQISRFTNLVVPQLETIEIKTLFELSRDVNDNYPLSLSIDGNADHLITGDMDLLVLEQIGRT